MNFIPLRHCALERETLTNRIRTLVVKKNRPEHRPANLIYAFSSRGIC